MNRVMKLAGVGLAYLLLGEASLLLSVPPGFFVPVWMPAGLAVAAATLWGRSMLLPIGLATLIVATDLAVRQFGTSLQTGLVLAAVTTLGALAQAEIGRLVLQRGHPDGGWRLETGREILLIIALAGPLAAIPMAIAFPVGVSLAGLEQAFSNIPIYLKSWLSSAVGIVAFAPVILLLAEREQVSRRRKVAVALPMALLLAIAVTVFAFSRADGIHDRREVFTTLAAGDHQATANTLDRLHHRLTQLGALFAASESVTPDEFETFVSIAFSRRVQVEDVSWAPRVADAGEARTAERTTLTTGPDVGVTLYSLAPDTSAGDSIATSLTGIDMRSIVDRVLAGETVVSQLLEHIAPDHGGHINGDAVTILIAAPAFGGRAAPVDAAERRRQLRGIALGRVNLLPLLSTRSAQHEADYRLRVDEVTASGIRHPLFGTGQAATPLSAVHRLEMGGLDLEFTYTATPDFLRTHQDWLSWATLVIGLAFITLLNALTLMSTARTDLVQRLVDRKTEEAESLSRNLALILENAADGILGINADGHATIVNPAAARLLGHAPEDLVGTLIHDIIHPVDSAGRVHSRADCPMVTTTREESVRNSIEPFRRKDGSSFTAEYSSEPILDERGSLLGVVTVFRDITERQQAQAERERFITELSRANDELERFAFAASHDLQEPLRLISNFNALLARRYGEQLDEAGHGYIQHSIRAAERMQALIADLLAYGRLNHEAEPRSAAVPVAEVVEDALNNLQTAIERAGARIEVGELPTVRGNRAQLTQLMQNLIGNAIKYQAPGAAASVRIDATADEAGWRIGVADNGIGIAEPYREQIFQPFKRLHAKDEYSGTGMGLAICRKIIESHGGVLWVEDNETGGSLFLFTLPGSPDNAS